MQAVSSSEIHSGATKHRTCHIVIDFSIFPNRSQIFVSVKDGIVLSSTNDKANSFSYWARYKLKFKTNAPQ